MPEKLRVQWFTDSDQKNVYLYKQLMNQLFGGAEVSAG